MNSQALFAALAVHLAAIVCLLVLPDAVPVPPSRTEPVVMVQLTPPAVTPSISAATPAPQAPAQLTAPPKPTPELTPKSAANISRASILKPRSVKSFGNAPSHPRPAPAAPNPVTTSATAILAVTQPTAGTARNAATTVTIQPKPISQPRPAYPALAQRRGLEGKVILQVTVGTDGTVQAVAVSRGSSHFLLDEAAVAGVWNWRFLPGQINGETKAMTISLPVDFRLR
ncbi:MAG TPA: hypothetical protein DEB25_04910 [Desulfobulbaceae bacterium]|nr:hypothetical protein [Desulfobulbaceae bacterium]